MSSSKKSCSRTCHHCASSEVMLKKKKTCEVQYLKAIQSAGMFPRSSERLFSFIPTNKMFLFLSDPFCTRKRQKWQDCVLIQTCLFPSDRWFTSPQVLTEMWKSVVKAWLDKAVCEAEPSHAPESRVQIWNQIRHRDAFFLWNKWLLL